MKDKVVCPKKSQMQTAQYQELYTDPFQKKKLSYKMQYLLRFHTEDFAGASQELNCIVLKKNMTPFEDKWNERDTKQAGWVMIKRCRNLCNQLQNQLGMPYENKTDEIRKLADAYIG